MSKRERLGICVVGAGALGTRHTDCWQQVSEAEVIAVADIDKERAKRLARNSGVSHWFTDYRTGIARDDVDVVSVCTPTFLHPEISIFAAKQGKHVFCEKPIALILERAEKMIDTAKREGVKLGIGLMRRFSKHTAEVKKLMQSGALGHPVIYQCQDIREIRPKRLMHEKECNGGPIIDMCVHYFDLWREIFSAEAVEVYAKGFIFAQEKKELSQVRSIHETIFGKAIFGQEGKELAIDTGVVIVKYSSGDIGVVTVCWGLPTGQPSLPEEQKLLGPMGIAQIGKDEIKIMQGKNVRTIGNLHIDPYMEEIKHFAQCILENKRPKVTGEDGKKALEVSLAALHSIESGGVVSLVEKK